MNDSTPQSSQLPQPTSPAPDLSGLSKTIEGLNDSINMITEQMETFGGTLEDIKSKQTPQTPTPEEDKTWKPKTWDEFPTMAEQVARKVIQDIYNEAENKDKEETEAQQQFQQQIDTEFDMQLAELEGKGVIPVVADVNNPADPGRMARKELFGLGIKYNSPNLLAMAELRNQLAEQGIAFDTKDNKLVRVSAGGTPPQGAWGKQAPVGSSAKVTGGKDKPTYNEIHNLSMDEMIRRFNG